MTQVLFVCVHNAGRSQMAEALFNDLAHRRRVPIRAVSAGTQVGREINPMVVVALGEMGISLAGHRPKALTQELVDASHRVISMGCGVDAASCPARFLVTEDWDLEDPAGKPLERVQAIRDEIARRVDRLLGEMESSLKAPEKPDASS